jgi:hypothetical protein
MERVTVDPGDGHFDDVAERVLGVMAQIKAMSRLAVELDTVLTEAGKALEISQPPLPGKLGVRWWQRWRGDPRVPMIVEWKTGPNNRFFPKRIEHKLLTRRVKSSGDFELNWDATSELMGVVQECLKQRAALGRRLAGMVGGLIYIDAQIEATREMKKKVRAVKLKVKGRLDKRQAALGQKLKVRKIVVK